MNAFLNALAPLHPAGDLILDTVLTDQIATWGRRARPADLSVRALAWARPAGTDYTA